MSSAGKRLSIINVKSGTGDIPGMRHGKREEPARRGRANGFS
jgi:hypothetical protein